MPSRRSVNYPSLTTVVRFFHVIIIRGLCGLVNIRGFYYVIKDRDFSSFIMRFFFTRPIASQDQRTRLQAFHPFFERSVNDNSARRMFYVSFISAVVK